jgi:hypothetical protein
VRARIHEPDEHRHAVRDTTPARGGDHRRPQPRRISRSREADADIRRVDAAGKPTVALQAKLDALGRGPLAVWAPMLSKAPDSLTIESDGKADAVFLRLDRKGQPAANWVAEALDARDRQLPIPKVMSYSARRLLQQRQVRPPAHRLLASTAPTSSR